MRKYGAFWYNNFHVFLIWHETNQPCTYDYNTFHIIFMYFRHVRTSSFFFMYKEDTCMLHKSFKPKCSYIFAYQLIKNAWLFDFMMDIKPWYKINHMKIKWLCFKMYNIPIIVFCYFLSPNLFSSIIVFIYIGIRSPFISLF